MFDRHVRDRPEHTMVTASLGGGIGGLLLVLIVLAAYFAPTVVAFARAHHQANTVLVINLFLGWTFVGWVVALAMSVGAVERRSGDRGGYDSRSA
jgi:cell division protein FtsX